MTKIFIENAIEIHGKKFNYSITLYVDVFLKVKFIYNTCGEIISIDASNLDVEDVVMLMLQRRL
jgi:hypothetical protein